MPGERPIARTEGLVVEEIGEELLVFDSDAQRAHSLIAAAAAVFQHADGTRTPAELARETGLDEDAVHLALGELGRCELLEAPFESTGVSRRAMLRRAAATGAAIGIGIPVIRSITAPTAAQAQASGCPDQCTSAGDCAGCSLNYACNSLNECNPACQGRGASCSLGEGDCCVGLFCRSSGGSPGSFSCQST